MNPNHTARIKTHPTWVIIWDGKLACSKFLSAERYAHTTFHDGESEKKRSSLQARSPSRVGTVS